MIVLGSRVTWVVGGLKGLMRRFSLSTGALDESLLTALGRGDDINRVVIAEESRQQVGHLTL